MKPHVFSTFIYAVVATSLAFIVRDTAWLALVALTSLLLSMLYGGRKVLYMLLLVAVGLIGVFINAVFFANTGEVVVNLGFIVIRSRALLEFTVVSLRLLLVAGAGGVFALTHSSSEIARGLSRELGLPYTVTLAVAFALRSIPLIKRDLDEVMFMRKQRGYRGVPLTPSTVSSILTPLLSIGYSRALWAGISAELRGLRAAKPTRKLVFNAVDVLLVVLSALYVASYLLITLLSKT